MVRLGMMFGFRIGFTGSMKGLANVLMLVDACYVSRNPSGGCESLHSNVQRALLFMPLL